MGILGNMLTQRLGEMGAHHQLLSLGFESGMYHMTFAPAVLANWAVGLVGSTLIEQATMDGQLASVFWGLYSQRMVTCLKKCYL